MIDTEIDDLPNRETIIALAARPDLFVQARMLRDQGHGALVSYSRKVFIPLTQLCRDVCHYCTFAHPPKKGERAYLTADEVVAIARAGAAAGCHEALFTLGEKPELRYSMAAEELAQLGHPSTISYLAAMCRLVHEETGLLPHVNPGTLTAAELSLLRQVSVSQGIMLESISERLCATGGPHFGSPDKHPVARLETIRLAGEAQIPFTSGILIGIGETREERIDALLALRAVHQRYGHIQEIIIQNFRAKAGTRMAGAPMPDLDDLKWTIAVARVLFGAAMNIQAPPNLTADDYAELIDAGINDWGGISPVTIDHVNPEAPWPEVELLRRATARAGKTLVERLPVYPSYCSEIDRWQDPDLARFVRQAADSDGFARLDPWSPGSLTIPWTGRTPAIHCRPVEPQIAAIVERGLQGVSTTETEIARLFTARGPDYDRICEAADDLRARETGDIVGYVVNRNINYTNVCTYRCGFCAFSKGKTAINLRGPAYDLALDEVARRAEEAWSRGAVEVCMQGGIHPDYTGETYLALCRTVKETVPELHIHAFSPLEVSHGAATLGISVEAFLTRLKKAGLSTLPGTAAEILDDNVRDIICPDKLRSQEWLDTVATAHRVGLRTTSTIMYGHVEGAMAWARHLLKIRQLQETTGGISEFVPLPFVHTEAPLYLAGHTRRGPTFREAVLMHAVARLVLHPVIKNIQVSWVKMGRDGARACLQAGANDLGGTLMNESISRAAGTQHGQEMPPEAMEELISSIDRRPWQRTTLYADAPVGQTARSFGATHLLPLVQTPLARKMRTA